MAKNSRYGCRAEKSKLFHKSVNPFTRSITDTDFISVLDTKIDIDVLDNVKNEIKYLCAENKNNEWSGILLYSVEGDFPNCKITLRDIIPMDIGSQSTTSYKFNDKGNDRHINYIMNHPEAEDWRIGHIHSHNEMGVFYSGTDQSELQDNAKCHDFYLSVVVNNKMDSVAKILKYYECVFKECELKPNNGPSRIADITSNFVYYEEVNCNISIKDNISELPEDFMNTYKELETERESRSYRGRYLPFGGYYTDNIVKDDVSHLEFPQKPSKSKPTDVFKKKKEQELLDQEEQQLRMLYGWGEEDGEINNPLLDEGCINGRRFYEH